MMGSRNSIQPGLPAPRASIVLAQIHVASPCRASWDDMNGDDRVRHCRQCAKNVYNLSGMRRADAEALVARMEGNLCVRFYRRADGTMLARSRRKSSGSGAASHGLDFPPVCVMGAPAPLPPPFAPPDGPNVPIDLEQPQ
jgi:hypothetical protein